MKLAVQDPLLKQTMLDRRSVILTFLYRSASSHCELCPLCVLLENPRLTRNLFTLCLVVLWPLSLLCIVFTKSNKQMSLYITRKYQSQIRPNNLSGASVGIICHSSLMLMHSNYFYVGCLYFFSSLSVKTSK